MTYDEFSDNFLKDTKLFPDKAACGYGYLEIYTLDARWIRFKPNSDYSLFSVEIRFHKGICNTDTVASMNYNQLIKWVNDEDLAEVSMINSVVRIPNKYYKNPSYKEGFLHKIFGIGKEEPHYTIGETAIIEWKGKQYFAKCLDSMAACYDDGIRYNSGTSWKLLKLV